MTLFICFKIWKGLGTKSALTWAVISLSVVLWWAFVPRIFDIKTPPALAAVGYMYLPFTGYFFIFLFAADLIEFGLWRSRRIMAICVIMYYKKMLKVGHAPIKFLQKIANGCKFNAKYKLLTAFALAVVVLCYGYYEERDIREREFAAPENMLPADAGTGTRTIKFARISHIGGSVTEVTLINAARNHRG